METYVIQLSESEGHFEYFNDRKVIWESLKENGKLTTIISDLTEKLQEIQQNANNKKDREIYNQMRWTEYLTDTPPPHLIHCLTEIQACSY